MAIPFRRPRPESRRVEWIGDTPSGDPAEPDDEVARVVHEAIVKRGLSREDAVAEALADTLFQRDLACGGFLVDIGFFWPLYLEDAHRALARLDGRLVRLGRC